MSKESVQVVIFNQERTKVLLIQREDIPVWVLPGGGIDPGETAEHAAIREAHEETGYHVKISRKIGEYLPVNRLTLFTHLFECEIISGRATCGDETRDVLFFPIHELPKLMPPPYANWIFDAHPIKTEMLKKKIQGVSYFVLLKLLLKHPFLVSSFLKIKFWACVNSIACRRQNL